MNEHVNDWKRHRARQRMGASLLDGARYVKAANTDIRKTFARVEREQKREQREAQPIPQNHVAIFRRTKP